MRFVAPVFSRVALAAVLVVASWSPSMVFAGTKYGILTAVTAERQDLGNGYSSALIVFGAAGWQKNSATRKTKVLASLGVVIYATGNDTTCDGTLFWTKFNKVQELSAKSVILSGSKGTYQPYSVANGAISNGAKTPASATMQWIMGDDRQGDFGAFVGQYGATVYGPDGSVLQQFYTATYKDENGEALGVYTMKRPSSLQKNIKTAVMKLTSKKGKKILARTVAALQKKGVGALSSTASLKMLQRAVLR